MPDIQIICGKCGNGFDVPENMGGLIAECPGCGSSISVPLPPDRAPLAGRLQVKKDAPVAGGTRCPSCGALMAEGAVLCVQCGFDNRTGRRVAEQPSRSQLVQTVLAVVGVVILAGLAWTYYRNTMSPREAPQAAEPAAGGEQDFPEPPVSTAAEPELPAEPGATQTVVAATNAPAVPDPQKEIDLRKAAAEYRVNLKKQLDARNPLYRVGESVVLYRTNGQVYRGTLESVRSNLVVVSVAGAATPVPLDTLERSSRVRCDVAFRNRVIEHEVQRRIKEMEEF